MLQYEYHDALLERVGFDLGQDVTLTFYLYSVFYPQEHRVSVRLTEVFNFKSFGTYLAPICSEQDADPSDSNLGTCESFHVDSKRVSSDGSLYFFLRIAGHGSFRIHCRAVSETLNPEQ